MKKILFLCVGNSCRSQMAEGFARYHALGTIKAYSAGTMPAISISGTAIKVMAEKGIDISHHIPKQFDPDRLWEYDILVSMGCGVQETCPYKYLKDFTDWGIDDPMGQHVQKYRQVRDEIEKRVQELVEHLSG